MNRKESRSKKDMIYRQGDVLLKRVSSIDAKNLVKINDSKTVAYGEVTGHHHSFQNQDQVLLYKPANSSSTTEQVPSYIEVSNGGATLTHQEHLPLQIEEGKYEVVIEQEYNPFTRALQRSVD